ncbi:MAG: 1-(5-phosphoribosyl)-5-[(5-phosphoribosylamino)methylideneamino]imidazole-4-carboxamide isomerase [Ardenticatenia bacterium]|nr:1-(5-phosphoribosyl)-5-[(5-phosphoribosylamino)methylideneamino]imidazole-4-carboxamide isomerase [Ardenticatenia bacterium]
MAPKVFPPEKFSITVFPAVDLRRGRCVRLVRGDPQAQTVYGDDPVAVAERWVAEGAEWLHVVNLDGAFGEESPNPKAVQAIVRAVPVPVQFGGGLRTLADVEGALSWGVARVVLGTVAVTNPELVRQAVEHFGPERIVVAVDARDTDVVIHGWQAEAKMDIFTLAEHMKQLGVERLLYTDVTRDGTLEGPNISRTGELAHKSGLRVIASGGVRSVDDIVQVRWLAGYGVEGVVVGQALYKGLVSLAEAVRAASVHPVAGERE